MLSFNVFGLIAYTYVLYVFYVSYALLPVIYCHVGNQFIRLIAQPSLCLTQNEFTIMCYLFYVTDTKCMILEQRAISITSVMKSLIRVIVFFITFMPIYWEFTCILIIKRQEIQEINCCSVRSRTRVLLKTSELLRSRKFADKSKPIFVLGLSSRSTRRWSRSTLSKPLMRNACVLNCSSMKSRTSVFYPSLLSLLAVHLHNA